MSPDNGRRQGRKEEDREGGRQKRREGGFHYIKGKTIGRETDQWLLEVEREEWNLLKIDSVRDLGGN